MSWWEVYVAKLPEGASLVNSKVTPGLVRGFYRGLDGIKGHGEFARIDARVPIVIFGALAISAGVIGTIAAQRTAPQIKAWWADSVVPTAQSALNTMTRREPTPHEAGTEMLTKNALDEFSSEIDVALEDTRTNMSSAEVQQYLLEILMAASIIADRMRALANARTDDEELPELASAMDKLTTQDVTDTINQMLESNTSLLDDEASAIFSKIFGGGQVEDGAFVPISKDGIKEAPSLPGREMPLRQETEQPDETDSASNGAEPEPEI